jgi:predicted amidophosphoribosyltransferase
MGIELILKCPECNADRDAKDNFCSNCGYDFNHPVVTGPVEKPKPHILQGIGLEMYEMACRLIDHLTENKNAL